MPKIKSASGGLNDNLFADVASSLKDTKNTKIANPIEFIEAPWGLNLCLTPVQKFMVKGIYNMPLDNEEPTIIVPDTTNNKVLHEFTEVEFAQWSYDTHRCNIDLSDPEAQKRNWYEIQFVLGRRSGKSTICSGIIDYEFYRVASLEDPHVYYDVPPGSEIAVIGSAPTDDQSDIVFSMALNFAQNSPFLKDRITHPTQKYFQLQTDQDIKKHGRGKNKHGSMQFLTGGSASNSIRGHAAIVIVIDEMAFFIENGGRFSIDELYGALSPSIAQFKGPGTDRIDGKILCLSSPYAHFGTFYDMYRDAFSKEFQKDGNRLVFRYYTALVNGARASSEFLKNEKRKDRGKFKREFEAEFDDRITSWVDSEAVFRNNIRRPYQENSGKAGTKYFYGFDLGLTDNGTAVSVVHKEQEKFVLDYAEVFYSKNSPVWDAALCTIYRDHEPCSKWADHEILPLFDFGAYVKLLNKKYPMYKGVIDQYSGHAFFQILHEHHGVYGIELQSINEAMKCKMFQLFKDLYTEGLLDLMDHPVLIPELLTLEAELRPGNKISVNKRASNDGSFHDDLSDATIRAFNACWTYYNLECGPGNKNGQSSELSIGGRRIGSYNNLGYSSMLLAKRKKAKMHGVVTSRTPPKPNK